jgi:hypothetical protein
MVLKCIYSDMLGMKGEDDIAWIPFTPQVIVDAPSEDDSAALDTYVAKLAYAMCILRINNAEVWKIIAAEIGRKNVHKGVERLYPLNEESQKSKIAR